MADAGNPPASPAKTCSICGIDVSGKPRAKDAQGRYLCQECLTKARQTKDIQQNPPKPAPPQAKQKPAGPSDTDNSFLLAMGGKNSVAESGTKPCPECGRALASDAVICVGCGYNFERGKRMQVKVIKAKQTDASGKPAAAAGGSILKSPHFIGIAVLIAFGAFAGLCLVQTELAPIFAIVTGIYSLIMGITVIVMAFQDDATSGVLCLLCGPYQIYWVLVKNENTLLKWLWCVSILVTIMGAFLDPAILESLQGGGSGP